MLLLSTATEEPKLPPQFEIFIAKEKEEETKPVTYTIQDNDSLVKIAEKFDTTWLRLFYKNDQIKHPDYLEVGTTITIPEDDETLTERLFVIEPVDSQVLSENTPETVKSGSNAPSGWYPAGQCTAHVASLRPVGQWNNASDWLWQAKRDGYATGSQPRAGAIAWKPGHVAYVVSASGSTMVISEANYDYRGSVRTIEVPVSSYSAFIY